MRAVVRLLLAAMLALGLSGASMGAEPVRIGLTPVFLDDEIRFLHVWRDYLARKLARPVVFVRRANYREVMDLLLDDKVDFAWICGYPYVRNQARLRLLALPLFRGRPLYQAYVIVPARDTTTASLGDLRGKVFAYSDPDSNSGFLYVQYELTRMHESPGEFFAKTFFTWAHRKVVEAVAAGLAQGGTVDGYVWETLKRQHPDLVGRTRVVRKSPEFGFPPLAARRNLAEAEFRAMQKVLLDMEDDPEGIAILSRLNLDGFAIGEPKLFDDIAQMVAAVAPPANATHP